MQMQVPSCSCPVAMGLPCGAENPVAAVVVEPQLGQLQYSALRRVVRWNPLLVQRFATAGPPELQKHAVDMHLGRFSRALRHLMSMQPPRFDDALALARDKVSVTTRRASV